MTDELAVPCNSRGVPRHTHTKYVQKKPIFDDYNVKHVRIESEDGHVFLFDKIAACKQADFFRLMFDAQDSFDSVSGTSSVASIKILGHSSPAIEEWLRYLAWRHRWINVTVEIIPGYKVPQNEALRQDLAMLAAFTDT